MITQVDDHPLRWHYRSALVKLIGEAKEEVIAITGEISAYRFFDIRLSVEEAIRRGVKFRVYAHNPSIDLVNRAVADGAELYVGNEDPGERYLVVDRRHWLVSESGQKGSGTLHEEDPAGAELVVEKFREYTRNLQPATKIAWETEPLLTLLPRSR